MNSTQSKSSNQKQRKKGDVFMTDEEFKKFSERIMNNQNVKNKNSKPKVITLKFNPLIVLVTVVLIVFLMFGFMRNDVFTSKISFDELIRGINDNRFSEIAIQNDGRVYATAKSFITYTGELDEFKSPTVEDQTSSNSSTTSTDVQPFVEKTLDDLVDALSSQDLLTQVRNLFNRQTNNISEVIVGDNFLIGIVQSGAGQNWIIKNESEKSLFERLEEKNINQSNISTAITKLRTKSVSVDKESFQNRLKSNQFTNVFLLNGMFVGRVNPDYVAKSYIDWSPSIHTFLTTLQEAGISFTSENYEIISLNVPAGLTFNDILTILTLAGFVILGVFIFRGAQSSGMGISQFGQSKAKLFFGAKTDTSFKDVAGIDEARDELNEIVEFLKNPNKFRKLGARIPKGVLMVGPPGTGKTLLARAIAGEAGVPFFHTSGSEFEEMLVGAGASRVRDLFSKAKRAAPALIFIDEIDAVARKRGTRIQSGTTEQTLNQILVEMDGFEKNTNVIVLAATNRPDVLDPAILRPGRFDRQIRIELPDMEGRKQILAVHGKNKPFAANVDLEKIAKRTVGFTGADLENILNESAIIAAKEGKKEIDMHDIEEAVSKVILGPAKKSRKRTDKELQLVAYHEAGHALVAKYTPESTPVDKISIISRGSSGGVTMFLPEKDEYIMSKRKLLAEITVSLGGRAAEEIALDDISTGASNDIEKATAMTRRMIQRFGMSEKLGLVQYGEFMENDYLGYAYETTKEYSDKTAEEIDGEVRRIIDEAYKNAKKVLSENRAKLDELAKVLLEKEVIGKEEFEALFA